MNGTHISAQPKPPWANSRGGCLILVCLEGIAERSSRGPEGVGTEFRVMPFGRVEGGGGFGDGARHWRAKGPNVMFVPSSILIVGERRINRDFVSR